MPVDMAKELERLPRFEQLVPAFLAKHREMSLVPYELIENGMAMTLIPSRPGPKIDRKFFDRATLPRLDLKAADIDWDRREDTIFASVTALLADKRFTMRSEDPELIDVSRFILPGFEWISILARINIISLQGHLPLGPSISKLKREVDTLYDDLPHATLVFEPAGPPIPGLDLSKPFRALRIVVEGMLIPIGSPEHMMLCAAARCYYAVGRLGEYEDWLERWFWFLPRWLFRRGIAYRETLFVEELNRYDAICAAAA